MVTFYMGLTLHTKTRRKDPVDVLYEKGLSVSYDRVLNVSSSVANAVISMYEDSGVVCPPVVKENGFITGNLDNIDHNPTSVTSKVSFHGTAISLTQHHSQVQSENQILQNYLLNESIVKSKVINELPEHYTEVPTVAVNHSHINPPVIQGCSLPPTLQIESDLSQYEWLNHVNELYSMNSNDKTPVMWWLILQVNV
ncbi:hypothetical protein DPMN_183480 [Dreissena polymorpha]|uniref:Uncharacterized protein n=1 Tax=Dreissena polymorpha TaxID=45954 RepID=A0A9D4I3M0_DREPO|nr:hypothetical protein DPMN_183480 [Dreissena polymorpha]